MHEEQLAQLELEKKEAKEKYGSSKLSFLKKRQNSIEDVLVDENQYKRFQSLQEITEYTWDVFTKDNEKEIRKYATDEIQNAHSGSKFQEV